MTQILLLTLVTITLLGCIVASLQKQNFLSKFAEGILPVLFFGNLIGLHQQLNTHGSEAVLNNFYLNKTSFIFLFLLNFLWTVFAIYSQRFWQVNLEKKPRQLRFFFTCVVAFLALIFISKNLMVTLFFYSCLILMAQIFAVRFLRDTEVSFLRLFNFFLYFESFFFFLAMVATYKLVGRVDFISGGIIGDSLSSDEQVLLLILYVLGLFFSVLLPYFLFFCSIKLEPIITYIFFFLAYGFGSLCIFVKLIHSMFGPENFAAIFADGGFGLVEIIFLFNIIAASIFLVFSKGIKLSFFYLFFQQFFFVIFAIFFFGIFNEKMIYVSLLSFSLSLTLIFFGTSNIISYLSKTGLKSIAGLFHQLPISTTLLIIGLVSLAGALPTIGAVEKFFLIKTIIQKHLWISAAIIFVNSAALLILAAKTIFHFLSSSAESVSEENIALARDIDFDSSLILTALLTAVLMFAGLFVTKLI